jgi:hypothetical protein
MHSFRSGSAPSRRARRFSMIAAAAGVTALIAGQSVAASAAPAGVTALLGPMTPALAAQLSQTVNQPVIVIMKNQPGQAPVGSQAASTRAAAIGSAQAPLMSELTAVHATRIKSYSRGRRPG